MIRNLLDRFVYFPMRYPQGEWDVQSRVGAADVWLTTPDHLGIHGWWFANRGAELATLFLHGNAGNVTHRGDHALAIAQAGSSVLVLDYRGYGKSTGAPAESGLYRDADAAYDWVRAAGFSGDRLILHGESLGSAVATELATRRPSAGLVLESPFTSLTDMANTVVPFLGGAFLRGFDTWTRIKSVHVPVLIVHGTADEIVPISQGKRIFAAANEPKTFWPVKGAGHNDLLDRAGTEYVARLKRMYASATRNEK